MAMRQKGSRIIVVDGTSYRWRVGPGERDVVSFAVELNKSPGNTLHVAIAGYDTFKPQDGVAITPADVARCIRDALRKGWQPAQCGKPFEIWDEDFERLKSSRICRPNSNNLIARIVKSVIKSMNGSFIREGNSWSRDSGVRATSWRYVVDSNSLVIEHNTSDELVLIGPPSLIEEVLRQTEHQAKHLNQDQ